MTVSESPYPRPGVRDWALLAINIVFVASGLLILSLNRDVGIVSLALFGPCLILAVVTLLRRFRFRRFRALKAEIVGGVPIRASRAQLLSIALVLTLMGVIIVLFGRSYPLLFLMLAWLIGLIGGALTDRRAVGAHSERLSQVRSRGHHVRPRALRIHGAVGQHCSNQRRTHERQSGAVHLAARL